MAAALGSIAVGCLTLLAVVVRPRGLSEGVAALLGGGAMLAFRLVPLDQAARVELENWNVFLFFFGMMATAALADQAGILDFLAYHAARLAGGRVRRLYIALFLIGALISLVLANDTTALVLTPVVYALVVRLALDPLPFVFATTFVADSASLGLPVSNPLNIIVSDAFRLDLGSYIGHLWLPAALVVVVNLVVFLVLFRSRLGGRFRPPVAPGEAPGQRGAFSIAAVLGAVYIVAAQVRIPLGVVAVGGALAFIAYLAGSRRLSLRRMAGDVSFSIFGFVAGMLLIVQGLHDSGVTAALGRIMVASAGTSHLQALAAASVGAALGSNLVNNVPMALVAVATIRPLHVSPALRLDLIYGTILGCDLGPNLTHLGSLATLIWLLFLRRRGLDVSAWEYLRVGLVVTPIMMAVAILGLWLTSGR